MSLSLPPYDLVERSFTREGDLANEVLYRLCRKYPKHKDTEHILAKVWLIGRAYATAIERRKSKDGLMNDNFYNEVVVPAFLKSNLDTHINTISHYEKLNFDNLMPTLRVHNHLITLIKRITGLEKRSFCSKYLHFHLPDLFFIYDSRAKSSLHKFITRPPGGFENVYRSGEVDGEYAEFACRCLVLRQSITDHYKVILTPRQVDHLLIRVANETTMLFKPINIKQL